MFKRRKKRAVVARVREAFWPSLGWARWVEYFRHRLGRMPGTPYAIACGFAFGAAISFTPFMGFHILFAGLMAYFARGSVLASAIGTVVGNPWTFPFIWLGIFKLGNLILGVSAEDLQTHRLSFGYLLDHPWEVFLPMAVGGVTVFAPVWAAFFFPLRRAIAGYQHRRFLRRQSKTMERARRAVEVAAGRTRGGRR
ncbi:DUF2062 domain-containing protein [Marivibrio halodurans]|uniref:DUF2062 domain-containing protein n=1 Tax=Marivibrio halodurans TaxID=2039722 RepID=A0A8J7UZN9_9PROT|nr:DUF2062 domain-containing protein [Marivibrio halodurans]MBP5855871.1 DUF2062 domain-containing protein [Marivibrio halodurans]